jgi:outer membrane autotransporter protein
MLFLRSFTALLLLALIVLLGSAAFAQDSGKRLYMAGYLGFNLFNDSDFSSNTAGISGDLELEDDVSFGGALGFRLSPQFSIEAELNYTSADTGRLSSNLGSVTTTGNLDITTLMLNAVYDFDLDWPIQPFVTAGAGIGYFDGSVRNNGVPFSTSADEYGLVYQVGAGLKYKFSDSMALTGGYRYLGSNDIDFGAGDIDYSAHEFRMGLTYDLPFE